MMCCNTEYFRIEWISNAAGPVVVEVEKPIGKVLDITLSSTTWNGVNVIFIDSVYEAGTADRSDNMISEENNYI